MRRLLAFLAVLALGVGTGTTVASAAGAKLPVDDVRVADGRKVSLTVTAPAKLAGSNIPAGAFAVEDGDEAVAPKVTRVSSDTLQVVLLMDTSGSMVGQPMTAAKAAAARFVRRMPPAAQLSVVEFSSDVNVLTGFQSSRAAHLRAIGGLQAAGETALYDGLSAAARQFREDGRRRAIVLLSDGADTVSNTTFAKTRRAVRRSAATVYGIRYSTAETNSAALDGLAGKGRVIPATNAAGLDRVYDTIAAELVSEYTLSWTSKSSGKTPVTITLAHGGVTATASVLVKLPGLPAPAAPDAEPGPAPQPAPIQETNPGPLGLRIALFIGAACFFLGSALLLLLVVAPRRRRIQMLATRAHHQEGFQRSLSELAEHAVQAAERSLERRNLSARLNAALERAGINLRPAEFLVLAASAVLTGFAAGVAINGLRIGILLALVVGIGTKLYVSLRAARRSAKFADQLNDTLQLLAGSLRAGYGMMQAIDSVAQEAAEPTAHEFRRLVVESRLGRDLTAALQAMGDRIRNEDFEWVVQAIMIHREVGGDLAEVLDTVAGTIRERNQVRRQVKALAAEGKLSGIILTVVPPAVGLMISFINPGYLNPLFTTLPGLLMSFTGLVLLIIGGLWMRKTVKLVF